MFGLSRELKPLAGDPFDRWWWNRLCDSLSCFWETLGSHSEIVWQTTHVLAWGVNNTYDFYSTTTSEGEWYCGEEFEVYIASSFESHNLTDWIFAGTFWTCYDYGATLVLHDVYNGEATAVGTVHFKGPTGSYKEISWNPLDAEGKHIIRVWTSAGAEDIVFGRNVHLRRVAI